MPRFHPGQSGNPQGRPAGREDKRNRLRALLAPHAPALIEKAVEKALEGDAAALRLCLERIIPAMRSREEAIPLPGIVIGGSLADQGRAVLSEMSAGTLTPSEASNVLSALSAQSKLIEMDELEQRIAALERRHSNG